MDYKELPGSADVFNSLDDSKRIDSFWYPIAVNDSGTHYISKDRAWVINKVNGYIVIASFDGEYEDNLDDILEGKLISVSAVEDLVDFIHSERKDIWNKWINTSLKIPDKGKQPEKYYYSNFLFVDAPYKEILEKVSTYFHNDFPMYPVDGDDHTIKSELINNWNPSINRNSTVLYFYGSEASLAGSGISLYIENTHLQLAENNLSHPIPSIIFQKCKTVPHIVEIGFSRKWRYSDIGYEIMLGLAEKFEGKAFMISSDYRVMAIKANKFLPLEEKITQLVEYVSDYISDESLKQAASDVSRLLGDYWHLLYKNSQTFLVTGFYLYNYAIRNSSRLFDTSVSSVAFSKCIETEIEQKIILPFKEHFEENFKLGDLLFDLKDEHLKRISLYLANKSLKPPELGSFAYFIKNVIRSKKRAEISGSIKAFKSFCQTRKNPDFFLDENNLCSKLVLISTRYRNGSAHTEILPVEKLIEFYNLLFRDAFIKELLDNTNPNFS